jgi:RHS repeat-associated protein
LQVWISSIYEEKNGQVLYHIYAGGQLVCTFDPTATNVFQYYHPNHLTSTSIQTDQNGNVVQHYEYSAFGQSRFTQSATVFPVSRRYTSQVLDDETGLYYYNARYYDPQLARFISPDDRIPDLGNPQSLNRFAYCLNNPVRFTDPDGNSAADAFRSVWAFSGNFIIGSLGEIGLGARFDPPSSEAGYNGRLAGRSAGATAAGYLAIKGSIDTGTGLGMMAVGATAEAATVGAGTPVAVPFVAAGAKQTVQGLIEGAAGTWGLMNASKLSPLEKPQGNKPSSPNPSKTFDQAREEAFKNAGMTDPSQVRFTKVDPKTGTVVEFKGPDGAKVSYDGPHKSPGLGHDSPHVGWQNPTSV